MQKNIISTTWLFIWGNGDIVNQARKDLKKFIYIIDKIPLIQTCI